MISLLYLFVLVVSIAGLVGIDQRHRLAFFAGRGWTTGLAVAVGVAVFLVWDVVGIAAGVFFQGPGPFQSGVMLGPELPLEELFFLTLLCYSSLLAYAASERALRERS